MSAPERVPRQEYGAIIVVGGGCYGGYYVRQLQRAARADAIAAREIVVVDRDSACRVALELRTGETETVIPVRVVIAEWRDFFDDYLGHAVGRAAASHEAVVGDAIVPSPLMPHLMGEWLVARARARWPDRAVVVRPVDRPPIVPWQRAGGDGTHYVSFATWMCPVNCIEPRTCPHTRGARSWSMPDQLATHARDEASAGRPLTVGTLHCSHRAYGVGMFDTTAVLACDDLIAAAGQGGDADVLIGTVSHCHGALTRLVIGPPEIGADSHVR
jgi:endonuclease/exonuclease/phosphatase (EEP) superfamily protein YafD